MNRIIYKNLNGKLSIIIPVAEVMESLGIKAIADKDVPNGLPYWFAIDSDIPSDREHRDAWDIDESISAPDGFGGVSDKFTEYQLNKINKNKAV